jgi:hypothetical protein
MSHAVAAKESPEAEKDAIELLPYGRRGDRRTKRFRSARSDGTNPDNSAVEHSFHTEVPYE